MKQRSTFLGSSLLLLIVSSQIQGARLKDLAKIRGVRENHLVGYGLVVGLPGTGDRASDFTENSLSQVLKSLGVDAKQLKVGSRNAAAVLVSASVPPFSRMGVSLDVTVSSIGTASSLEGGALLMTPLKGADGKIYAVAQGRLVVAKKSDRGTSAFQAMLSAQVPGGAILEKDVQYDFANLKEIRYQLAHPDFTTSARISHRINEELGGKFASAVDAGTVDVILPYNLDLSPVDVVARIENLEVEPDRQAKVVVNRRTGTIVLGDQVRIYPVSIAHNNIRIQIRDEKDLSATVPNSAPSLRIPESDGNGAPPRREREMSVGTKGASIAEIVTSLNEVGATADDLVFLLQALRSSGALIAEVEMQ